MSTISTLYVYAVWTRFQEDDKEEETTQQDQRRREVGDRGDGEWKRERERVREIH